MAGKSNRKNGIYFYVDPDLAWEYIETGKDVDELFPDGWGAKSKMDKSILLEGETYEYINSNYIVTSCGRVFSLTQQNLRQMIVCFYTHKVNVNMRDEKLDLLELLSKYGWTYTNKSLRNMYNKHKWKHHEYAYSPTGQGYKLHHYEK